MQRELLRATPPSPPLPACSNLSAGTLTVLLGLFLKALHVFPYAALAARTCLVSPSPAHAWWQHAACFLLCDMFFYWCAHIPHILHTAWVAPALAPCSLAHSFTGAPGLRVPHITYHRKGGTQFLWRAASYN